jgi:hypothetical protein
MKYSFQFSAENGSGVAGARAHTLVFLFNEPYDRRMVYTMDVKVQYFVWPAISSRVGISFDNRRSNL